MNITDADREALALAPLLDEALGALCSYDRAAKIYVAITPLLEAHRIAGIKAGLEAAAKVMDIMSDNLHKEWRAGHKASSYLEGQSDGADRGASAIRAIDPATVVETE